MLSLFRYPLDIGAKIEFVCCVINISGRHSQRLQTLLFVDSYLFVQPVEMNSMLEL